MSEAENPSQEQPVQDSTVGEPLDTSTTGEQPADTDSTSEGTATFELEGQNVSLDELKAGYLRQADYTRKTQKLSEDQKKYEQLLDQFKGQTQNTVVSTEPADSPHTVPNNIPQDVVERFTKWEQGQKAKERITEWDSFKAETGLKLTEEEEAAFISDLAQKDSQGQPVNIREAAALRYVHKIAEAKAKQMIAEELERAKDQSKTVGPGTGGKVAPVKSDFDALVKLARQHGVE